MFGKVTEEQKEVIKEAIINVDPEGKYIKTAAFFLFKMLLDVILILCGVHTRLLAVLLIIDGSLVYHFNKKIVTLWINWINEHGFDNTK